METAHGNRRTCVYGFFTSGSVAPMRQRRSDRQVVLRYRKPKPWTPAERMVLAQLKAQ